MEAPKCKICGVAHWSNQPHAGMMTKETAKAVAADKESRAKASKAKPVEAKGVDRNGDASRPSRGGGSPAVDLTVRGTPRKRAPKGTFDRKAYQREKARERRAAAREAKK